MRKLTGTKGEIQKERRQGDRANAKQTGITPSARSSSRERGNKGAFGTWVSIAGSTHDRRSRDTPSEGCTHPPIQPTQLLRKLFKPFIFVVPYGGIATRGRGGNASSRRASRRGRSKGSSCRQVTRQATRRVGPHPVGPIGQ
jgi:hypothetical protein